MNFRFRIPRPRAYTDGSNDMTECILHHADDQALSRCRGHTSTCPWLLEFLGMVNCVLKTDCTHFAKASLCLENMPQQCRKILSTATVAFIMGRNVRTSPTIRLCSNDTYPTGTTASWHPGLWEAQIDRFVVTEAAKLPWCRNKLWKYDRGNSIAMAISFFKGVASKTRCTLEAVICWQGRVPIALEERRQLLH